MYLALNPLHPPHPPTTRLFCPRMSSFGDSSYRQRAYVPQPPDDTVSRLRFSPPPTSDTYLVAASWNGSIRCWKVDTHTPAAAAVSMAEQAAPILDCCWAADGSAVYFGGVAKHVSRWDLGSGAMTTVAAHDGAIRCICDVEENSLLATASWDKSLRYWDVRVPTGSPVGSVGLADRAYAMDVTGPLMVVGLADRKLVVYDVRKPSVPFREKYTQLWYQTRCVATWPDRMGYLVGGVDGRVSVDYVREGDGGNFSCHKEKGKGFAINAIRFHRQSGYFATAGSDGRFGFWDKDRRERARTRRFEKEKGPICDIDFVDNGRLFGYAVGYDWSMGAAGNTAGAESTYIVLEKLEENELEGRHNGYGGGRSRGRGGRRRGGSSRR